MHVSSGSTSGAYMHSASKDNGVVHGFLLRSAELTRRVRTGLSKVRPRLAALRGVLGGGEHDGGGSLRCGALGFSRGGNALAFARGGTELHDEDEDLV